MTNSVASGRPMDKSFSTAHVPERTGVCLLPCWSFFARGRRLEGFFCAVLQLSIVGWIPAAIWAVLAARSLEATQRSVLNHLDRRLGATRSSRRA